MSYRHRGQLEIHQTIVADIRKQLGAATSMNRDRAVNLNRLVDSRSLVGDDPHADEIDADYIANASCLVIRKAKEDGSSLRDLEVRWVTGGVAAGAEDIEFRERRISRARRENDVRQDATDDGDTDKQGYR